MNSYSFLPINYLLSVPAFVTDHVVEWISCGCLVVTTGFAAYKYYQEAKKAQAERNHLKG